MSALEFGPNLDGHVDAAIDLQMYAYSRTEQVLARWEARDNTLGTTDDLRRRQLEIRAAVVAGVGGLPDPRTPQRPRKVTGHVEGVGFTVEKTIFESLPEV
ncbi:MAG: hypothetical protein ACRDP8_10040 [Actinopolymorphaceae bacterium]